MNYPELGQDSVLEQDLNKQPKVPQLPWDNFFRLSTNTESCDSCLNAG